ncbi:hypothetical protein N7537_007289 [Penicillium hordei]|uniref:Zn(2)-C6 fungal-type domain-containing protein n=1 Tax=Penicillium hordei TaxID=40994 RepID=A0AAD6DYI4_9EURO|nr:uncharacterized protein N7537_007289 [Penicillium hordei]KAJ5597205.1 hypothetical protein N7537_007289 [Penicillium hordei]
MLATVGADVSSEECRRRKIKCDGQQPCHRCGNLDLTCLWPPQRHIKNAEWNLGRYAAPAKPVAPTVVDPSDSRDVKALRSQVISLQVELQAMSAQLKQAIEYRDSEPKIQQDTPTSREGQGHTHVKHSHTSNVTYRKDCLYHGPAGTAFTFDIARANLQSMGLMSVSTDDDNSLDYYSTDDDPEVSQHVPDPLDLVSPEEVLRLCKAFAEETNVMYPFLDMNKIMGQIEILRTAQDAKGSRTISGDDRDIIVLVLAISLIRESAGESELGRSLFHSIRNRLDKRIWAPLSITGISSLVLAARYYFYADEDERMAWRTIGIAARQCFELGLHHLQGYSKFDEEASRSALVLFWSVFALDRRWSFGTGLPFSIQEEDIDLSLPEPDDSHKYLKTMIPYCRLSTKVWYSGLGTGAISKLRRDGMESLDSQVLQWHQQMPESLKCPNPYSVEVGLPTIPRILQIQMYVRTNTMRVLIYRPILYSYTNIMQDMPHAVLCVHLAKDTIRILYHTHKATKFYKTHQTLFNFFILSSLAIILLACFHDPADFCSCVQEEVFMALELVKVLNSKSRVARRLWKSIRDLREVGERLGVLSPASPVEKSQTSTVFHDTDIQPFSVNSVDETDVPMPGTRVSAELTGLLQEIGIYHPLTTVYLSQGNENNEFDNRPPELSWENLTAPQWSNADGLSEVLNPLLWNW